MNGKLGLLFWIHWCYNSKKNKRFRLPFGVDDDDDQYDAKLLVMS